VMARQRDRSYVVTVGTRLYLARGADPDHALDGLRARYGEQFRLADVQIREATSADLDLAELIDSDNEEVRAWIARVPR
jgi:hypothetical protein